MQIHNLERCNPIKESYSEKPVTTKRITSQLQSNGGINLFIG